MDGLEFQPSGTFFFFSWLVLFFEPWVLDGVLDLSLGTVRYGVGSGFGFDMSEPWYGMGWDGVGLTLGRGGTGRYIHRVCYGGMFDEGENFLVGRSGVCVCRKAR